MEEVLDYNDLQPKRISVKYAKCQYWLNEASGGASVAYRNARMACHVRNGQGDLIGFKNLADLEPLLISLCLTDAQNKPVPIATISSWPASLTGDLFEKAKAISELDEEDSSEKLELLDALSLPNAPIDVEKLGAYLISLDKAKFTSIQSWFAPSLEDRLKNDAAGMAVGSG